MVKKTGVGLCELCGLGILFLVVYGGLSKMKISVYSVVKKFGVVGKQNKKLCVLCGLV